MTDTNESGFRVNNLEEIPNRYRCIICHLVIRVALQLVGCGHRLCQCCLNSILSDSDSIVIDCPSGECEDVTEVSKIRLDKAFQRDLDILKVQCYYYNQCSWSGLLKDYQNHLDFVHNIFNCKYCHTSFKTSNELDIHENSNCPEVFSPCPLMPHCSDGMIHRDQALIHILSLKHQEAIAKILEMIKPYAGTIHQHIEAENVAEEREFTRRFQDDLSKIYDLIKSVSNNSVNVNQTQERLKSSIEKLQKDLKEMSATIVERLLIIEDIRSNQMKLKLEIDFLYQYHENYSPISTNGTLVWRINGISKILADAQNERKTWILSPEFYSSPCGYRMRVRLFPYGDGPAKRTHMSLFFMLMKGEYDAILTWPFPYRISFCLLDQVGKDHLVDSFLPDVKSSSFQRPKTEANIPNGIPKFVPLSSIQQDGSVYVVEDTIYLKIFVDFSESLQSTPAELLATETYMPLHYQENLQRQAIEKQRNSEQLMSTND